MDGRGRRMDNVFIERLWRSLKYECIYLHAFETGSECCATIKVRVRDNQDEKVSGGWAEGRA
jgi:transposase InsO family protein